MANDFNAGDGCQIVPLDIGHAEYVGLVSPDTAFWALVKKDQLGAVLTSSSLLDKYRVKEKAFSVEMDTLRFKLKPSAVYFNPTDLCNLNCGYCYIPEHLRKNGKHMGPGKLLDALEILKAYFASTLPKGQKPQIIFHGAEPLLNQRAIFPAIDRLAKDFRFGIQTNATLLDAKAVEFLTSRGIAIGISLDGHCAQIADSLRRDWSDKGVFSKVMEALALLRGYDNYSVIATVTKENIAAQTDIIELLHKMEVPACMLNPVRCTLSGGRGCKPLDANVAKHYFKALDRSYELYRKSGRKLIVANFANILISILAPMARRLMCDISPCGGGRCFFAVASSGDIFPCSEFIGIKKFRGGNLFKDKIADVLDATQFKVVTQRRIEKIEPCNRCAVRHFCGAPCPAEAHEMNGSLETRGAFCELYAEQVRYALRLIADGEENAYLWDYWDKDTSVTFKMGEL